MHLCGDDLQAVHFTTPMMYVWKSAELLWILKIDLKIIFNVFGAERRLDLWLSYSLYEPR